MAVYETVKENFQVFGSLLRELRGRLIEGRGHPRGCGTYVVETLRVYKKEIKEMYNVRRMSVFGAYTRGEQKATSSIDVLAGFGKYTFDT
uniref:Polymerase nucleotidyl transferase domain-containing protein n=1 Tax=Candidatus Methanogaster sp. ANME-2c ERB4 TaxID=2759911 RepID=A0A7G9YNN8_9EURY|nr:hypothetical protein AIHMFPNM_00024 [Methanosarcinales archaeon ANME-2c ERB4]